MDYYVVDVVVQLVTIKCLPVLCYAIEVCPTIKSDALSLQYVIDTRFRKIFSVKSKDVVHECDTEFRVFRRQKEKVNFSPITCYASCTKNRNEIILVCCVRVHSFSKV